MSIFSKQIQRRRPRTHQASCCAPMADCKSCGPISAAQWLSGSLRNKKNSFQSLQCRISRLFWKKKCLVTKTCHGFFHTSFCCESSKLPVDLWTTVDLWLSRRPSRCHHRSLSRTLVLMQGLDFQVQLTVCLPGLGPAGHLDEFVEDLPGVRRLRQPGRLGTSTAHR